ncbi:hypothetical protein QUF70_12580 [Desulfobacterales bacterium HSG17]|nr:hypothetical protein [Desulfobacterales bacterium HSG17]
MKKDLDKFTLVINGKNRKEFLSTGPHEVKFEEWKWATEHFFSNKGR